MATAHVTITHTPGRPVSSDRIPVVTLVHVAPVKETPGYEDLRRQCHTRPEHAPLNLCELTHA